MQTKKPVCANVFSRSNAKRNDGVQSANEYGNAPAQTRKSAALTPKVLALPVYAWILSRSNAKHNDGVQNTQNMVTRMRN